MLKRIIRYFIILLFVLCLILGVVYFAFIHRTISENIQNSSNYHNGKFQNTVSTPSVLNFNNIIKFIFTQSWGKWPKWIENQTFPTPLVQENQVTLTFINHATFLLEIEGKHILFDPMFSETAGIFNWIGVKRRRNPGISLKELPYIDIILISHNHYDHLDLPTLKFLSERSAPKVVVPLGDKKWLEEAGIKNVIELDWWQSIKIDPCFQIHFVPAQHSSAREILDLDQSFWGGFVVEHPNITLFHAGDTGYANHFKEIGKRFKIDIAMLPIGAYKPSWLLNHMHMSPSDAVQAHKDLKAKKSFSMHSDTFPLSALNYLEAKEELKQVLAQDDPAAKSFNTLQIGESYYHHLYNSCAK